MFWPLISRVASCELKTNRNSFEGRERGPIRSPSAAGGESPAVKFLCDLGRLGGAATRAGELAGRVRGSGDRRWGVERKRELIKMEAMA
jgi:hypothetical protein